MEQKYERTAQNLFAEPEEVASSSLIPNDILDHASQRLVAISIFAAIQCCKIYDILLIKGDAFAISKAASATGDSSVIAGSLTDLNNFTFVLKYAFIDGLFLWLLPVLNIPFLVFSPLFTLLLTVGINAVNFALTSNGALPILQSTFIPVWNMFHKHKELTITGDAVSPQSSIDMDSHFRGKYTIQYLPESSVMLDPFNFRNMCLESPESGSILFPSSIFLPVEFNTTSDIGHISIQRMTPGNTVEYMNYTTKEIRKLVRRDYSKYEKFSNYVSTDERVFYMDVEVKKPGKYKIHEVLDTEGMSIRQYKSEFTIGNCPFAQFSYLGRETTYSGYRCFSKDASDLSWSVPMVSAFGMLPLTVKIATYQNGKMINTFEKTISDAESRVTEGLSRLQSLAITRNSLEQELLRAPENFKNISSGKLEFQLLSVSDSHGNERIYNVQSKDKDVNFPLELKQAPTFMLKDIQPTRKLTINSSKTLHIDIFGAASFPVTVTLVHEMEKSALKTQTLNYTFKTNEDVENGLQITEPGKYYLLSGSDKYCACQADSTPITIVRPSLPSVEVKSVPILDKCVGTIGYEFDLQFGGSPPFEVSYEVYQNTSNKLTPILSHYNSMEHKIVSKDLNFSFHFQPNKEGNYLLIFKSVKDVYYEEPVSIAQTENSFSTQIKKRSQFLFFKGTRARIETINLCKGKSTEVAVHFEGHLPFSYRSEIVHLKTGKVLNSQVHENQAANSVALKIPKFPDGGEYAVYLRDVTDSLGCPVQLPFDQQIRFNARNDSPVAEITDSTATYIIEGDAVKVPLKVHSSSGRSTDDNLVYSWTSPVDPGNTRDFTLYGKTDLVVRTEGTYKLKSFVNAGCLGTIKNEDNEFTVRYHAKPNLSVILTTEQLDSSSGPGSLALTPLCQSEKREAKIHLSGKKPYVVSYEIKFPSGNKKSALMHIDNDEIALPLNSSHEGNYQIFFTQIYDSLYTKEKMQKRSFPHATSTITYEVKAPALLKVKEPFRQVCVNKVKEDFDLEFPLALSGIAPFKVEGDIIGHDSTIRRFVIDGIREPIVRLSDFNLKSAYTDVFTVGEYRVVFRSVSDASHCQSSRLVEDNQVLISITEVPSITKHNLKEYYCVGDRVSYNMSGVSPFMVYYKFNGKKRKASVKNDFTRLATEPGDLAIVALQDSSDSHCLVNLTKQETEYENLRLRVHDLPSVEISHGDSIIKNIHEGDQSEITFKFVGTPPFSVTYVRTLGGENVQHKRKSKSQKCIRKVVETKTITDIWNFEYSEVVHLQGTYEAIQVTDAFCNASRDVSEIL